MPRGQVATATGIPAVNVVRRGSIVRVGRRDVRAILFVVAGVVRRYDLDFAAFHQRLSAAGKPKKVIRVALAHKLLVRLNAKARQVRNEFVPLQA